METLKQNKITLFFLIAILLHFLLFFTFIVEFKFSQKMFKPDLKSLPAYIYHEEKYTPPKKMQLPTDKSEEKPVSKDGIEKPHPEKTQQLQTQSETLSLGKGQQNVNLQLKAKNSIDKPLLNLLTKAVATHLVYPKIAVDFRLHGRALIGFILYPDGHLTDVTVVESSGAQILDEAAFDAIKAIDPVKNVNFYLNQPEPLLMGVVFQ